MLATRIIPVLLHRGHTLVKGEKFNSWRSVGNVMQASRIHAARSVDELCILNIGATADKTGPDFKMVDSLCGGNFTPITVGGGVRSINDVRKLLNVGADKVSIGSAAFYDLEIVSDCARHFGSQAIVVALDVLDGFVVGRCGLDRSNISAIDYAKRIQLCGAGEILLTSVDKEGTMLGYDLDLISNVSKSVTIPVIANGGCRDYDDMYQAIKAGASAVAAGALFQFTDATPKGAAQYLHNKGIEVRL